MTDLGALNYFLGISADRTPTGLFLSQKKYALQLLERAHMVTCNPSRIPVDTESKLGPEGAPVQDPTLYRSLAGGLQYLTFTCPDLSYAVQQICLICGGGGGGYGYIKNHKKTVKNGQARTRESEEYKKKPKIQSRSQKSQASVKSSQNGQIMVNKSQQDPKYSI
ncbi:ribonuclease H-like domain-containing protein [Tanacetum coccineum]